MKLILLFLAVLVTCVLWPSDLSFAQCPEAPNDNGVCDTIYFELYECDWLFAGETKYVRIPIRVTHDAPYPSVDSIAGMVIPLRYTSSNPAHVTIDPNRNLCGPENMRPWMHNILYDLNLCIFHHLPSMEDPQEHNWMMDLSGMGGGQEWDNRELQLNVPGEFRLALVAVGAEDQRFPEGNRVLMATMTFTVDDTMTICLDSCFWPPSGHLTFGRGDAQTYVPRHNLPYCFSVTYAHTGDCNTDCLIDIGDVVYLISYLFRNSDPPFPLSVGDANCDGIVDVGDVVFLINYLFRGGPAPSC